LFGELLTKGSDCNKLISPTSKDKELLFDIYKRLKTASEQGESLQQFYLILEMIDIISHSVTKTTVRQSIPEVLTAILMEINKRFIEINSLKIFTDKYGISQSTLNRLFKKHLNTSPKTYLETKRLAYSRTLLCDGKTVFEACMLSGFPDYSNYIRLFKKHIGTTPKQYQEKQKQK
jgi:AraC-like DNA-binding protein